MSTGPAAKRSPWVFFSLVFILAAPFWLIGAITKQALPRELGLNLPFSALTFLCPMAAAVILVYRVEKAAGVKRLLTSVFDARRTTHKIWYVPCIFVMPLIMVLSYGAMRLMGLPLPGLHISVLTIPILFVVYFVAAYAEEVGWTGYAIDPLQTRWNALGASVILGSVWALVHIVPYIQANDTPAWIAGQSLFTVTARILIVWLYNNTGKSVLSAVLFHDMINVSDALFPDYSSPYAPAIFGAITAIMAVIVAYLWGPTTLARYRYARAQ